jgi:hypothetical protein
MLGNLLSGSQPPPFPPIPIFPNTNPPPTLPSYTPVHQPQSSSNVQEVVDESPMSDEESDEEKIEERTEVTPFWSFDLPDGRFYIIIAKHEMLSYDIHFQENFLTIRATTKVTSQEIRTIATALGMTATLIEQNFAPEVLETTIQTPFPLVNLPKRHECQDRPDLIIFSYPKKIEASTISF